MGNHKQLEDLSMVSVYVITNTVSGSLYIGMTSMALAKRFNSHKDMVRQGKKTPLYDAMRSYGKDNFRIDLYAELPTRAEAGALEAKLIVEKRETDRIYNLAPGGSGGYVIQDKESWMKKLKLARVGRKPFDGMQHTDNSKAASQKASIAYWETQDTYNPQDIIGLTHREAKAKLGISTTHYYRLKKELTRSNAPC